MPAFTCDFNWSSLGSIVTHPVSAGIAAGLIVGKLVGIAGLSGFLWLYLSAEKKGGGYNVQKNYWQRTKIY